MFLHVWRSKCRLPSLLIIMHQTRLRKLLRYCVFVLGVSFVLTILLKLYSYQGDNTRRATVSMLSGGSCDTLSDGLSFSAKLINVLSEKHVLSEKRVINFNSSLSSFRLSDDKENQAAAITATKNNSADAHHFLVCFTTMDDSSHRRYIHRNTLNNWARFTSSNMQPVLFLARQTMSSFNRSNNIRNWHVYPVPRANKYHTPYLISMVKSVLRRYNSSFYGFANADILFDDGLVETLRVIEQSASLLHGPPFVIGRRTDFWLPFTDSSSASIDSFHAVGRLSRAGTLDNPFAEDYFLFTHSFPWHRINRRIVIGRPAYDNYLVRLAGELNLAVIDATLTIHALHQHSSYDPLQPALRKPDADHNVRVLGNEMSYYDHGHTTSARYETRFDLSTLSIRIFDRQLKRFLNNITSSRTYD